MEYVLTALIGLAVNACWGPNSTTDVLRLDWQAEPTAPLIRLDQCRTRVNLAFHKGSEEHVRVLRDAQHLADQLGLGIAELGHAGLALTVGTPERASELLLKTRGIPKTDASVSSAQFSIAAVS